VSTPLEQIKPATSGQPLAGVVLLGGAHGALAMARNFGRQGIPVVLVSNDHPLPKWSRYLLSQFEWAGAEAPEAAEWLLKLAERHGYLDWLLLPCGDSEVKLVASAHQLLRGSFRLLSSEWDRLSALCDKQMLAASAANVGVAVPKNYRVRSASEAASVDIVFPVVLKPAMRLAWNAFTQAKAWRADTRGEFIARYRDAAELVGDENVVVQELIPGGGDAQFSYVALWHKGAPVAEMTARRTRQYPLEFSYTSTFVEVCANNAIRQASTRLLSTIAFEGLVEIEYKLDARDGRHKILDVNPRPWSWIALCEASGLDLAQAMQDIAGGKAVRPATIRSGVAWVHMTRDVVASLQLMARGQLSLGDYVASLRQRLVFSTFAWDDLLPGLLDIPITLCRVAARRARASAGDARSTDHPTPHRSATHSSGSARP
jgi:D-aspartate ligase